MSTFSDPFDVTTPLGTDLRSAGDDKIRELKRAINERYSVEHDLPTASGSGLSGRHKFAFGNTASRPTDIVAGTIYFNTETGGVEIYNGSSWLEISGALTAEVSADSTSTVTVGTSYADVTGAVVTIPEAGDYLVYGVATFDVTAQGGATDPTKVALAVQKNSGAHESIFSQNVPAYESIDVDIRNSGWVKYTGLAASDTLQLRARKENDTNPTIQIPSGTATIFANRVA